MTVHENESTIGLKFCPRCVLEADNAAALCPRCGDRLHEQGYCGICEQFLLQSPGSSCPKHDVSLDDSAPTPYDLSGSEGLQWTTVKVYEVESKLGPARVRLEAEEIPTFVEGERMGSNGLAHVSSGGLKLQVPWSLAADARAILAQTWQSVLEDDDLDDAWDDLAPDHHASLLETMKNAYITILSLGSIGLVLTLVFLYLVR